MLRVCEEHSGCAVSYIAKSKFDYECPMCEMVRLEKSTAREHRDETDELSAKVEELERERDELKVQIVSLEDKVECLERQVSELHVSRS